jgi:mannosyltransferase
VPPEAPGAATRPAAHRLGRVLSRGGLGWGLIAAAIAAGLVLRFIAPADLWLDEAQSVAIARLPLPQLFDALRQDGSPPLYYLLLHAWTAVAGEGAGAVRVLSGLLSAASLPLAWVLGRRLAGPRGGIALALLLAASPFAVRYGSETRMYALLVLLALLAGLAVSRAVRRPGPASVVAVALSAAALLLTHYWAAYLVAVAALIAVAGLRRDRRVAGRVLAGLALAAVLFLPWLPSLLVQLESTGTPWAEVGGLSSIPTALTAWQGGRTAPAVLLGVLLVCLAVIALVATPHRGDGSSPAGRLAWARSPLPWLLLALSFGTLAVGGLASWVTSSAVSPRYTSVALPAFLALVAGGLVAVPGRRASAALLAVVVALGLGVATSKVRTPRTQAGEVAAALGRATPGDVVAFCPDQLGPAVSRLAPDGLDLVGYPDLRPVDRIDWTDYAQRNEAGDPAATAAELDARAGGHALWVVTGRGFRVPSDDDCRALRAALAGLRGEPVQLVERRPSVGEGMRLHRFAG